MTRKIVDASRSSEGVPRFGLKRPGSYQAFVDDPKEVELPHIHLIIGWIDVVGGLSRIQNPWWASGCFESKFQVDSAFR